MIEDHDHYQRAIGWLHLCAQTATTMETGPGIAAMLCHVLERLEARQIDVAPYKRQLLRLVERRMAGEIGARDYRLDLRDLASDVVSAMDLLLPLK